MIGEPSVHVGYPLDRETAPVQSSFEFGQARVAVGLQGSRLLRDAGILGDPVAKETADAGESQLDLTADLAGYREPATGIVAEEHHGRCPGQGCELRADVGQLTGADGDQDEIPGGARRVIDDADQGLRAAARHDVTRVQAVRGQSVGPGRVTEHRDGVPGSRQVCAVDGADHACTHDEDFQDGLPGRFCSRGEQSIERAVTIGQA
ncbi:MAG: hypothetical protein ABJB47_11425 [Actinomycetota bacterium]